MTNMAIDKETEGRVRRKREEAGRKGEREKGVGSVTGGEEH